jgi:hypothetical protein
MHHWRPRSLTIQGAVVRKDEDTRKQLPITDAVITASDGVTSVTTQSDAGGYFTLTFPEAVLPNQALQLTFQHPDYESTKLHLQTGLRLTSRELFVARMTPLPEKLPSEVKGPAEAVTNIRVRYTVNLQSEENIGSAVHTFQVVNKGNVPCDGHGPCSPDGLWKAASGSISLDAGPGNEFRSVRGSCIAGPCPFTRLDASGYVNGGRNITASAVDWSDTATFLIEAEVFRTAMTSRVRYLYPVFFGPTMQFTLPPTQEGVTIEADVNATPMVFPLGTDLYLSWATCTTRKSNDSEQTVVYRCELKPGYKF